MYKGSHVMKARFSYYTSKTVIPINHRVYIKWIRLRVARSFGKAKKRSRYPFCSAWARRFHSIRAGNPRLTLSLSSSASRKDVFLKRTEGRLPGRPSLREQSARVYGSKCTRGSDIGLRSPTARATTIGCLFIMGFFVGRRWFSLS